MEEIVFSARNCQGVEYWVSIAEHESSWLITDSEEVESVLDSKSEALWLAFQAIVKRVI